MTASCSICASSCRTSKRLSHSPGNVPRASPKRVRDLRRCEHARTTRRPRSRAARPSSRSGVDSSSNVAKRLSNCLLYTSDAADDLLCVDLGGRRIIKKKKYKQKKTQNK